MVSTSGKHVFVDPANNRHMAAYIRTIVPDYVNPENVILFHDSSKCSSERLGFLPFRYDCREMLNAGDLSCARTIHFLSITPKNSPYILTASRSVGSSELIFVIVTDDEVNRFRRCKQIFGRLKTSRRYQIDVNVLKVLQVVDNFLTKKEPWGNELEKLLGRSIWCSDFTAIRNISRLRESLKDAVRNRALPGGPIQVLHDSRPPTNMQRIRLLSCLLVCALLFPSRLPSVGITVYVWRNGKMLWPVGLLDTVIKAVISECARRLAIKIKIREIHKMPFSEYDRLLSSIDFMIARGRGGRGGCATLMCKGGLVSFPKGSLNQRAVSSLFETGAQPVHRGYFNAFMRIECLMKRRDRIFQVYKARALDNLAKRESFYVEFYGCQAH